MEIILILLEKQTYDFDSPSDGRVTVRERDTMAQERIGLDDVVPYLAERLAGC